LTSTSTAHRRARSWPVVAVCALAVLAVSWSAFASQPAAVDGVRMVIRATARCSLLLFCLAFGASALHQRWPGRWTHWLLQRRRGFGLGFAFSHGVHALAIASLAQVDRTVFDTLVNTQMLVLGGLGYVFIAAMAATSNDAAQRWLGARRWAGLHRVGGWYLALGFLSGFGKRAAADPVAAAFLALMVAVLLLRWSVRWWPAAKGLAGSSSIR
jgi:sulfoxide reductase heme-binding subunit YedZ